MERRRLGRSDLEVSLVGLGCNNFGLRCDAAETRSVVERALDVGINFFDTADVYGQRGDSERYLGAALGARRSDAIIATKFGAPMGDEPALRGAGRERVLRAAEDSLKRLGTDWIDLYQLHLPDSATPMEETLEALDQLVRQGKVRWIGCSNLAAWQLVDALWTSRSRGGAGFVSAQNYWNLLRRGVEAELVPACTRFGVGILPYFPLASGLLTGKYRRDQPPPAGTRLAEPGGHRAGPRDDATWTTVESLDEFARSRGRSLLELAFAWLTTHDCVASVIAGATRPEQVAQNAESADWRLDEAERAEVSELARRSA